MDKATRENLVLLIRATAHTYADWWILEPGDSRSAELYRLYADALTETMNAVETAICNAQPRMASSLDDETRQFLLMEADRLESTIRATTDQERVYDKAAKFIRAGLARTAVACP
jgi:hypothetical protein